MTKLEVKEKIKGRPEESLSNRRGKMHGVRERTEQWSLVIAWVVLFIIFSALQPQVFPTLANISSMFGSNATLAMLALGLIIVLRAGEFDLSIAANMTFCAMFLGILTVQMQVPLVVALILTVIMGAAVGAINAVIVLYLDVNSFITTLGMGTLLQGFSIWISGNRTITGIPQPLVDWVVVNRLFSIPLAFFYALIVMFGLWYVFRYTSSGRRLLFVGKSPEVARLSGVNIVRVRFSAFVSGGAIAGVAALLYAGSSGSADPTSGLSYLLPAFAAAFLGATALEVGEFNPIGTVVAVYLLVFGVTGLAILGVPTFVQQLFYGGALIIAVALSAWAARSKRRALEASQAQMRS